MLDFKKRQKYHPGAFMPLLNNRFNKDSSKRVIATLSSNLYWYWYTITSNLRHQNPYDVYNIPIPESIFESPDLLVLGIKYIDNLTENSKPLIRVQKQTGTVETQSFVISKSKPIIDEIDKLLAKHYGFTHEELDFIINYDIKYCMGLGKAGANEEDE